MLNYASSEDGAINEMKLPFRHRVRNSSPGGLRPCMLLSVTGDPHNVESLRVRGKENFVSLKFEDQSGVRVRDNRLYKQAALTASGSPPLATCREGNMMIT